MPRIRVDLRPSTIKFDDGEHPVVSGLARFGATMAQLPMQMAQLRMQETEQAEDKRRFDAKHGLDVSADGRAGEQHALNMKMGEGEYETRENQATFDGLRDDPLANSGPETPLEPGVLDDWKRAEEGKETRKAARTDWSVLKDEDGLPTMQHERHTGEIRPFDGAGAPPPPPGGTGDPAADAAAAEEAAAAESGWHPADVAAGGATALATGYALKKGVNAAGRVLPRMGLSASAAGGAGAAALAYGAYSAADLGKDIYDGTLGDGMKDDAMLPGSAGAVGRGVAEYAAGSEGFTEGPLQDQQARDTLDEIIAGGNVGKAGWGRKATAWTAGKMLPGISSDESIQNAHSARMSTAHADLGRVLRATVKDPAERKAMEALLQEAVAAQEKDPNSGAIEAFATDLRAALQEH